MGGRRSTQKGLLRSISLGGAYHFCSGSSTSRFLPPLPALEISTYRYHLTTCSSLPGLPDTCRIFVRAISTFVSFLLEWRCSAWNFLECTCTTWNAPVLAWAMPPPGVPWAPACHLPCSTWMGSCHTCHLPAMPLGSAPCRRVCAPHHLGCSGIPATSWVGCCLGVTLHCLPYLPATCFLPGLPAFLPQVHLWATGYRRAVHCSVLMVIPAPGFYRRGTCLPRLYRVPAPFPPQRDTILRRWEMQYLESGLEVPRRALPPAGAVCGCLPATILPCLLPPASFPVRHSGTTVWWWMQTCLPATCRYKCTCLEIDTVRCRSAAWACRWVLGNSLDTCHFDFGSTGACTVDDPPALQTCSISGLPACCRLPFVPACKPAPGATISIPPGISLVHSTWRLTWVGLGWEHGAYRRLPPAFWDTCHFLWSAVSLDAIDSPFTVLPAWIPAVPHLLEGTGIFWNLHSPLVPVLPCHLPALFLGTSAICWEACHHPPGCMGRAFAELLLEDLPGRACLFGRYLYGLPITCRSACHRSTDAPGLNTACLDFTTCTWDLPPGLCAIDTTWAAPLLRSGVRFLGVGVLPLPFPFCTGSPLCLHLHHYVTSTLPAFCISPAIATSLPFYHLLGGPLPALPATTDTISVLPLIPGSCLLGLGMGWRWCWVEQWG